MWLAPGSVGCQALPCVEAAGHWLVGPVSGLGVCRAGSAGSGVGLLVGGTSS